MIKRSILLCAVGLWTGLSLQVSAQSECAAPEKPEVVDVVDRQVFLEWKSPEPVYGLFDDFESHEDFAINSPGSIGWNYWDMDNSETYGISDYQYEGRGKPSAFQVFNPSKTNPAYTSVRGLPHSGSRYLISFSTINEQRNDWLISPDLQPYGFTDSVRLAFYARSFSSTYGLEKIKVGYSLDDKVPGSFVFLNQGAEIEVPESDLENPGMYYFEFVFPPQVRYVAINCVTNGGFALMIDDVAIGTNRLMPTKAERDYLIGYNLYRNGGKVNAGLIRETSYTDTVPLYGQAEYAVEAVYESCVSAKSGITQVDVPDIHQLPFVETFDSFSFGTNFWETSPEESYWSVDYIDGGLIDPAARFKPRAALENYSDYCLTSMELDASGLDSVMLSYDIALDNYLTTTVEYMQAQVYDGEKWVTLKTHTNQAGSFGYDRIYLDISRYAAGRKFRIRFNGGGADAYSIIAWYVSYVRVYEKEKSTVAGTVSLEGSPLAGMPVVLSGEYGDIYQTVSGQDGNYALTGVDAGRYELGVNAKGYNPYAREVVLQQGANRFDIAMTRPSVAFSPVSVRHEIKAEDTLRAAIRMQNTGNGPVTARVWVEYADKPKQEPRFELIRTFRPSDLMQAAICFDGEFIYMGSNYDTYDGTVWKYDRAGNYLESFVPDINVRKYYGMAFDGAFFYVACGDAKIRVMDFAEKRLVDEIPTEIPVIKHIAYDPERDAFWVGDFSTIALVDRNGSVLEAEVEVEASFSGSVYDPWCQAGPSLWIIDQSNPYNPANPSDLATIRRFDLNSMRVKEDYVFPCETLPGYVHGQGPVSTWGVGLYGCTDYERGKFVIMGSIVSDPGLVFVLDMYDVPAWLQPADAKVELPANSDFPLSYKVDGSDMLDQESRLAEVRMRFEPEIEPESIPVEVYVTGKALHGKPLDLAVRVENDEKAVLSWASPQSETEPLRYYVYRNGLKIDSADGLGYVDSALKAGGYAYAVSALYPDGTESALSREVSVRIYVGIPCYPPQRLTAANRLNKTISLSWLDPSETGIEPAELRWDNGINYDGIGLSSAGIFEGGAAWTPAELSDYRGMKLRSVSFIPYGTAEYVLKVYEDKKLVYSQEIEEYVPGQQVEAVLSETYRINDRAELIVCIEANSATGGLVLGVDQGPAREGKGNVIYGTEYGWTTLTAVGGSNANFNLALGLDPKQEGDGPVESDAESFNVYRDGFRINTEPVKGYRYEDSIDVPGSYTYHVTAVYADCESDPSNSASARIMDITRHTAPQDLQAQVEMNRKVELYWNQPSTHDESAKAAYRAFDYIGHVSLHATSEQAVATDGQSIYTVYWNRNGEFNRYDMEGNYIETFEVEGLGGIYDLTYDGTYFYGGGGSETLYCLDLANHAVVREIPVTGTVRHCTYIPDLDNGKGGFEIGDWTTSYFVSRNGAYLDYGVGTLDGASGAAYRDGKLYYFLQGQGGYCQIAEYDFSTLKPTGQQTDLAVWPILDLPDDARAGGLDSYVAPNGTVVLLASVQQSSPRTNTLVYLEVGPNPSVEGFNLYRDGKKINWTLLSNRTYADTLDQAGSYLYTVTAVYVDGEESEQSGAVSVEIVSPEHCESPVNLHVSLLQRNAQLNWSVPMEEGLQGDDFESYSHQETGTVGRYTTLDLDGRPTWKSEELGFTQAGEPGSFLVLDQSRLQPSLSGLAYSGDKFLAAFGALPDNGDSLAYSNDYLIVPVEKKKGKSHWLSFMARSWKAGIREFFKIAYSVSGTRVENFIWITPEEESVYHLWTRFAYEIPEDAEYVAVNYVSGNGYALFLDDLKVDTLQVKLEGETRFDADEDFEESVYGYYVYRNGELLTPEPVRTNSYFDGNLANGTYSYQVKALYNTSCLSPLSDACEVEVSVDEPCRAPTDLQARLSDNSDVELQWSEPVAAESQTLSYVRTNVQSAYMTDVETYYLGAKWNPVDLMGVYGYSVRSITAMFYSRPLALELLIYQDGELVYSEDVTDQCLDGVSEFVLPQPLLPDYSKDLLVAFRIEAESGSPTMVVDGGPSVIGMGDLYSEDGKDWISSYVYSGLDVNWAVMVNMDMYRPAKAANALQGYLLYRNNEPVMKEFIRETSYLDRGLAAGSYTYAVSAVYTECGEVKSDPVTVSVVGNEGSDPSARIVVYPNPAADYVRVKGACRQIELLNLQGEVLQCVRADSSPEIRIGLSSCASGVYFLRVTAENGSMYLHKLVVR